MSDATVVRLRGEGGGEWEFELPLSEVFSDQVKSRMLTPADDDSAAALAYLFEEPAAGEPADGELTLEQQIDQVGSHAAANELAARLGVEGFGDKSPKLDAKKDALKAKAAEIATAADEEGQVGA